MRVLYVTANPHLRSTTSSLNAIIRGLQPRGVRPVMLFTARGPWQEQLEAEGIPCHIRPLVTPDRKHPFRALWYTYQLLTLIWRERIALIHCNDHDLYPCLRVAARWARIPILTTLHWNLEQGFGYWAFKHPYTPAALQFLSRAQLGVSREGIPPNVPPERVKLLMSGLNVDELLRSEGDGQDLRAAWGVPAGAVVIGSASAIMPRKQLEDFIQIVESLHRSGRSVFGVIAGGGLFEDPEYRRKLEALIAREHLESICRIVPNLEPVTPFFRAIDIAVNTSEMEILSMSICEAMACGKPTLAYAIGGNPETVQDEWCVVPLGKVDELTHRVAQLVDDAAMRKRIGDAAQLHIRQHFDGPLLADRQAAIYNEIMGSALPAAVASAGHARARGAGV